MSTAGLPWIDAWQDALYGERGFYRRDEGPAGHFATSAQGIPGVADVLAQTLLAYAERAEVEVVVDFACGRGELLDALAQFAEPSLALVGVDVVDRPGGLDDRIEWQRSPGGRQVPSLDFLDGRRTLVFAHEWLDVVPCVVAEADDEGRLREVHVEPDGTESLGDLLDEEHVAWARRWWPGQTTDESDLRPGDSSTALAESTRGAYDEARNRNGTPSSPTALAESTLGAYAEVGSRDGTTPSSPAALAESTRGAYDEAGNSSGNPSTPQAAAATGNRDTTTSPSAITTHPGHAAEPVVAPEPSMRWVPGERVEIGASRDAAWSALAAAVIRDAGAGSVVVGVDYGHTRESRPPLGTLTGFRDGAEYAPLPDGSCDVTAHVATDSLDTDHVTTQRAVVLDLFGEEPLAPVPRDLARTDPPAYLQRLAARSALGAAVSRDGLGAFHWFVRETSPQLS